MNRLERKPRWDELCDKVEALIREYGDVIMDADDVFNDDGGTPDITDNDLPAWTDPMSILDWSLVIAVEDADPEISQRGHWILHLEPWRSPPYRTLGLLTQRIEDLK